MCVYDVNQEKIEFMTVINYAHKQLFDIMSSVSEIKELCPYANKICRYNQKNACNLYHNKDKDICLHNMVGKCTFSDCNKAHGKNVQDEVWEVQGEKFIVPKARLDALLERHGNPKKPQECSSYERRKPFIKKEATCNVTNRNVAPCETFKHDEPIQANEIQDVKFDITIDDELIKNLSVDKTIITDAIAQKMIGDPKPLYNLIATLELAIKNMQIIHENLKTLSKSQ